MQRESTEQRASSTRSARDGQPRPASDKHSATELELKYWKENLVGNLAALDLPFDRARSGESAQKRGTSTWDLTPSQKASVQTATLREGTDINSVLLAVFHTLLYRYTGQDDLLVVIPVGVAEKSSAAGADTLRVLRTRISREMSFAKLLRQIRLSLSEAKKYATLPIDELLQQMELNLDQRALMQVAFCGFRVTDPDVSDGSELVAMPLSHINPSGLTSFSDLALGFEALDGQLQGQIEFNEG